MKCHANLKFMQFQPFYGTFSSFQNFEIAILKFKLKIFSKFFGLKLAQNVPNRYKMPCKPKINAIPVILWHFFKFQNFEIAILIFILIFKLKIFSKFFGLKLAQNVPNRFEMPCKLEIYAFPVILWHFFKISKF